MFVDKEGKPFDPNAAVTIDEVQYPMGYFQDPAVREEFGITEVTLPAPPSDFSYDYYYVNSTDTAPYMTYTQKPIAQLIPLWEVRIEAARDAACVADVTTIISGTTYKWQADTDTQARLGNALGLAIAGIIPAPTFWRTSDNINVTVALTDLKAIAAAMAQQVSNAYVKAFALKTQANAATTLAELEAIEIAF